MSQQTSIEWTDFSSNPLRYRDGAGKVVWACAKVSAGCAHCYSEAIAHRYRKGGPFSLAQVKKVEPFLDEKECRRLLTSRKLSGKRVFIGDMTDIFGEWVPFELLDRLFAVFALRPDVTFQLLTKRPERMAEYMTKNYDGAWWAFCDMYHPDMHAMARDFWRFADGGRCAFWPLPNIWLGTSCEDQATADERIPRLLRCPAAVRFISAEPLLGPMGLAEFLGDELSAALVHHQRTGHDCGSGYCDECEAVWDHENVTGGWGRLDWVISGGESGPGARPCNLDWIRSIRDQCRAARVSCFVKQLGRVAFEAKTDRRWTTVSHQRSGRVDSVMSDDGNEPLECIPILDLRDRKGGDIDEFPDDLKVRQFPREAVPA